MGANPSWLFFCTRELRANGFHHSWKNCDGAKSFGSNLLLGLKRGKTVKNCQKHGDNYTFFQWIAGFFKVKEKITSESLTLSYLKSGKNHLLSSIFCKERREWFSHGGSFIKSDKSDSLTVTLFKERWEQICSSWSLFKKIDFERKSEEQKTKEHIFNPEGGGKGVEKK